METKREIRHAIQSLECDIHIKQNHIVYWATVISLVKKDIKRDPTNKSYQDELKEARDYYTKTCRELHQMKVERNKLQRIQNAM